ncbi:MAG: LCP family protein, partial [Phototrophicaceae bacterium]
MRVPGWLILVGIFVWFVGTVALAGGAFAAGRYIQVSNGVDGVPLPQLGIPHNNGQLAPTAILQVASPTPPPTVSPVNGQTAVPTLTLVAPVDVATLPPDENSFIRAALGRVGPRKINVLLLGIDQRSAVESAATEYFRTDTMIVLQIDPARRSAAMLSIPRDLYVSIPGFTAARINTANVLGDSGRLPGGGPALAMRTVEEALGLDLDHYVLVNFEVFETVVDSVAPNGVEVCIQEAIYDPTYPDEGYGFIEVRFEPGCQRLDTTRLLQYARTRKTQGSDFDRARRQQQVITAIQNEVISAGGITNLLTQAPALWGSLSGNLRTDLDFQTAVDLALIASTIDRDNIQTAVIDNLYVTFQKDESGADILVPVPSAISVLIQETFNPQGNLTSDDLRGRAEAESASIAVLNNTEVVGIATRTRDWLAARGVNVATVGNATTPTNSQTVIRDYTGNPYTARYVASVMGLPIDRILTGSDGQAVADVVVLVGNDIETFLTP